jgi:hypothetical protein
MTNVEVGDKMLRLKQLLLDSITLLSEITGQVPENERLQWDVDWKSGRFKLTFSGDIDGSMSGSLNNDNMSLSHVVKP